MTNMMEEVYQQPAALSGLRKYYSSPGVIPAKTLRKLVTHWPPTVVFTGMGSSLFAAYPAQAYLSSLGIRSVVWETAELIHHHMKFLGPDTLLVVVSQSGETVEVLRLLERLPKKMGIVGVANVENSTLVRRAALLLPMMAGRQSRVSTKTYTCAVAVLMYLAFAIARKPARTLTQALKEAIEQQERLLDRAGVLVPPAAEFFGQPQYVALMGRGAELASVHQGALMFKEVVRLGAEPMSAGQFRHGPVEIINPAHRYIIFGRDGKTGKLLTKLADDIRANGGRVLLISDQPFADTTNVRLVRVAPIPLFLGTLVDSVYIQLLVHELALRAGLEPGKFWLATEVTREE
ncbi:MAG: SIS domain-containing protein [Terriglobia bacterium]|jgi:glucosamine--fructose-6-phosphate aminotransferase (isomerizing)